MKRNLLLLLLLIAVALTARTETVMVATSEELMAAFASAESGDTIKLAADIEVADATIHNAMDVTLDLNVFKLTAANAIYIDCPSVLTITGDGQIVSLDNYAAIRAISYTAADTTILNINGGEIIGSGEAMAISVVGNTTSSTDTFALRPAYPVVVNFSGGKLKAHDGICLFGTGAELNMTGGEIECVIYGITGNGTVPNFGTKMNISGGTVLASDSGAAIYHTPYGSVSISDSASLTGGTGIEMCSGSLTITGGLVHATGEHNVVVSTGLLADGGALTLINRFNSKGPYPGGKPVINVSGGTFISDQHLAVSTFMWKKSKGAWGSSEWVDAANYIDISGGTFNTNFDAELCAEGFEIQDNMDGTYTVVEKGNTTRIEYTDEASEKAACKQFRDGQLLIHRDGRIYTVTGCQIQ